MTHYQYTRLNVAEEEIRLLTLLPGSHDAPLIGIISHVSLKPPVERKTPRLSLKALEETLPPGWKVGETYEGRYIFWIAKTEQTFWNHPDPTVDAILYEGFTDDTPTDFKPQFEALSYVWGSKEDPDLLELRQDRSETGVSVSITRNLGTALRHLRNPNSSRVLWVDAVCIDQTCIPEINAQVPRMSLIYKLAGRVILWVGPSADRSSLALAGLEEIGKKVEITKSGWLLPWPGSLNLDEDGWKSWPHYPTALELAWDDETFAALDAILKRPWFSRLWVIQEALLGNRHTIFQCGHDKISWNNFREAVDILRYKTTPSSASNNTLTALKNTMRDISQYQPGILLRIASTRECSDLRDKVYGVLSITPPNFKARVQVDYSLPVVDVYRKTFHNLLDHSCRLDILLYTGVDPGKKLPSWMPDWSREPDNKISIFGLASGCSRACVQFEGPSVMIVTGVHVSKIVRIEKLAGLESATAAKSIRRLWLQVITRENRESMLDRFISCLTRERNKNYFPDSWYPTPGQWKEEFMDSIFGDQVTEEKARLPQRLIADPGILINVLIKSVAVMEGGYVGLVSPSAQEGDIVVNFLGCSMPLVLRQALNSGDHDFEIVSEAFVPGTMHAELLLGPLPSTFSTGYALDKLGYTIDWFKNNITGERQRDDPRLGPDPKGWERLPQERTQDDPLTFVRFRNTETSEVVNWDPRLTPEALTARGVKLEKFRLV
ncbi:heterokaryon incompatibility protein-domain-containing protein [Hypoxylon rubiginosum]|uniref:Heterokaryon incompatibility protein-domain-containing protein n=1 Tax=Hypoxylon rubiginosum TaxID=110542 RepID=A0ACC0CZR8_9PEZI|nr:heterokaryon incompatibility protein-domain-containing protein [Hypoxylon rubiginosum]